MNKPLLSIFKSLCCPAGKADGAGRPRLRRKEDRPGELVAAALELFVERGYAATRLDDVAALAGVTKGTLYLYYENKEALFKAVVAHNMVPLIEEARKRSESHQGSMSSLLQDMLLGWWEQIGATTVGGILKLIVSEAGNFPEAAAYYHASVIVPARELIGQVIRRGMDSGEFRPVNAEVCFHVIFAPLLMLVLWRNSFSVCGQDVDHEEYLKTAIEFSLAGLRRQEKDGKES